MAEFVHQKHPQVMPLSCYFCGAFEGPFVNTMTSDPLGRIILICSANDNRKQGCAGQIAEACGGCGPEGREDYEQQLSVGDEIIAGLRKDLDTLEPLRRVRDELAEAQVG